MGVTRYYNSIGLRQRQPLPVLPPVQIEPRAQGNYRRACECGDCQVCRHRESNARYYRRKKAKLCQS